MKYLVLICAVVSVSLIFAGIYFDLQDDPLKHKMYGLGTIGIFIITFPLFLFWRRDKMTRDKFIWTNPKEDRKDDKKGD